MFDFNYNNGNIKICKFCNKDFKSILLDEFSEISYEGACDHINDNQLIRLQISHCFDIKHMNDFNKNNGLTWHPCFGASTPKQHIRVKNYILDLSITDDQVMLNSQEMFKDSYIYLNDFTAKKINNIWFRCNLEAVWSSNYQNKTIIINDELGKSSDGTAMLYSNKSNLELNLMTSLQKNGSLESIVDEIKTLELFS
jgi:hypothetical protein